MEVHCDDMIASSYDEHIGDELGRDRRPRLVLLIHASIREAGDNGCDTPRRRSLACRDKDKKFHERIVHIARSRLEDEDVFLPNRLGDFDRRLAVGELFNDARCQLYVEPGRGYSWREGESRETQRSHRSATAWASSGWLLPVKHW